MRGQNDSNELVLGEFVLGQRPEIEIHIYRMLNGDRLDEDPVRTITAGYNDARYPSPRVAPPGQYVGVYPHTVPPPDPPPVLPKPMEGACAYWDGLWDRDDGLNPTAGTNAPVRGDIPPNGSYYAAYLVVDGVLLANEDQFVAFEKDA